MLHINPYHWCIKDYIVSFLSLPLMYKGLHCFIFVLTTDVQRITLFHFVLWSLPLMYKGLHCFISVLTTDVQRMTLFHFCPYHWCIKDYIVSFLSLPLMYNGLHCFIFVLTTDVQRITLFHFCPCFIVVLTTDV